MWQALLPSLNIIKINWQLGFLKNCRNSFLTKYKVLGPGGLKNVEQHNEKCILRKQDRLCHVWIKRTEKWKVGFDFAETRQIFTTCDGWRFLKRNPTNRLIWPMILTNLRTRRTMRKSNTPWLDCTIKREITNIYSQHFLSWKWYKWPSYIRVVST